MPVGRVDYLNIGPMTFTEFLGAVGKEGLARAVDAFEWPPGMQEVRADVRSKRGVETVRYRLLSLPLYLVERLPELVKAC